jgi:hypothetical protein
MTIDKALNPAPMGLAALPDASEPELQIEIENPESVTLDDGSMEITLVPGAPAEVEFDANLAECMEETDLNVLASDLMQEIDNDRNSRADWEQTYIKGLELLGLKYEPRTTPWAGACGATHPMLTEAIVRFQSETITETFPAQGPVRTKIIGAETPDKRAAAARVQEDLNHQLTDVMHEFRLEHERMLWSLPATGSAFKKVYFDSALDRQISVFVPAEDILLPYGTSDINTTHRVTHVMRKTENELRKLQIAGFYRDIDLGSPTRTRDDIQEAKDEQTGFRDLNDELFELYEVHADLDLPGFEDDAGALPYVVTILRSSGEVLSIRRNWAEEDARRAKRQHFVHYQYVPGFGAYGFGLFHLVGGFATSATSLMRQLVDAGTLANLPGGLKARGLRVKNDDSPIMPGEFRDVDVASGSIRDNIMPLPYKEPSATLFTLLTNIVEEGRRFAATADLKISDMSAQAPVGTTLAILERQLKIMSAVQARVHTSLKQELRLIAGIIRDYSDESYTYDPERAGRSARRSDYAHVDILPVSDANAATLSQRVVQYQAVMQMAQQAPQIYDLPQLHRGMLEVMGIKNADKILPLPEDQKPMDPVTENMRVLKLEPVKAFVHQDHESHIRVHMAAIQDPMMMQLIGQNPNAAQIQSAAMAHIAEHVAYAYRQKIEQQLGMALPPETDTLPPEVETALSGMMAQAAQQVLQQNQQAAAQQAAQQAAQDPVLQMQQAELKIREREVNVREQKVVVDAILNAEKLNLDKEKLKGALQLDSFNAAAKVAKDRDQLKADNLARGLELATKMKSAAQPKPAPGDGAKRPPAKKAAKKDS